MDKMTNVSMGVYLMSLVIFVCSLLVLCLFNGSPIEAIYWYYRQYSRQFNAWKAHRRFDTLCGDFNMIQLTLLFKILKNNAHTEYGQKNNFSNIYTLPDFKSTLPFTNHDSYKSYIDRMIRGEKGLITSFPVDAFSMASADICSSWKYVPISRQLIDEINQIVVMCVSLPLTDGKPKFSLNLPTKLVRILLPPKTECTELGIPIGPLGSFVEEANPSCPETVLPQVNLDELEGREKDLFYIIWLFALYRRDVKLIHSFTASLLHASFKVLENEWGNLLSDVRSGTIRPDLEISEELRRSLQRHLYSNPIRAKDLNRIAQSGFKGIAKRIWPNLSALMAITSGPFKMYRELLDSGPASGVPVISYLLASSEGVLGVNFRTSTGPNQNPPYILLPSVFYEFKPENSTDNRTLYCDQLVSGQKYEIIVTNQWGFYRYSTGDIIRFIGHFHQAPMVEYLYRRGQVLNLKGENVSEEHLVTALNATLLDSIGDSDASTTWLEFCFTHSQCLPELKSDGSFFYILFVELDQEYYKADISSQFDEYLRQICRDYDVQREHGSLDQSQVYTVSQGTLSKMRENASEHQIKSVSRFVTSRDKLRFLLSQSEI